MKNCNGHVYCKKCKPEIAEKIRQNCLSSPPRRPKGIHTKMPKGHNNRKLSDETKKKISINNGAHKPEIRAKIKEGVIRYLTNKDWSFNQVPTNIEHALSLLLQEAGLEFEAQKRFGKRIVDFYISSHNIVFEADGSYWYQDKNKERVRDKELRE